MTFKKLRKHPKPLSSKTISARNAIAISALLLTTGNLHAQKGFDLGLKGEIMTSSLLNSTDQAAGSELNYKNKIHGAGGIGAGYTFNRHMGAEIDVLYSKQGQGYTGNPAEISANSGAVLSSEFRKLAGNHNITFTGNSYTSNINLTYIKIPLLFRYTGVNTKKIFFSSFIGVQIDLLSSADIQVNGSSANSFWTLKSADAYKKMGVDGVLGLGAGYNLSPNLLLTLHLRVDYGFGDAEDKSASYTLPSVPAFNPTYKFYSSDRASTHNATGGALISLNYKFVKEKKEPAKVAPKRK